MDFKNKCAQCWGKVQVFWAKFLAACGVAWDFTKDKAGKAKVWLGAAWGKTRVWLRKVWNKTNIWATKVWRVLKIVLNKLKLWLGTAWKFLSVNARRGAGKLAVAALKFRKWFLKKTARLRSWWARWKVRIWMADKVEKIRAKLPQPAQEPEMEEEPADEVQSQEMAEDWDEEYEEKIPVQPAPVRRKPARKHCKFVLILLAIWKVFSTTCVWIYRLRKYIMAAPVAFYAIKLAFANANRLPDMVGMDIQANGEFARMVSRQSAVFGPFALTCFCLVLVLCSKKPLQPWLISIFTLILPILIWMTNNFA